MRNISFWILGMTGLLMTEAEAAPVVIWASDPVRPGETVVVRGDSFGKKAKGRFPCRAKGIGRRRTFCSRRNEL